MKSLAFITLGWLTKTLLLCVCQIHDPAFVKLLSPEELIDFYVIRYLTLY